MKPRRKILMLTTQLGYGGAETSFIRLANFLSESMDVTVALFTRDYGQGAYAKGHEPLNAKVVLLDNTETCSRLKRWAHRVRTLRALKAQHDVAISFLSGPNLVNALAGLRERTIVSLRGSRRFDPLAPKLQRRLFQHVLDPMTYRLASHIVPVSSGLRHEIGQGSSMQAKIHPIPPFIDFEGLQQRLQYYLPEEYAALRGQRIIVAAGRLSIEKGFHDLIRIFVHVSKRVADVKLLLIGDGPMLSQLQTQCTDLGLSINTMSPDAASVIFSGYQKNVMPFMALGSVYALTSATEGFPSVLLEAMAAGVPVVAADTPWGARAILCGNEPHTREPYPTTKPTVVDYGTLMPRIDDVAYEAIWVDTLCKHLLERPPQSQKIHERVKDFDITRIGAQWQTLIESVAP